MKYEEKLKPVSPDSYISKAYSIRFRYIAENGKPLKNGEGFARANTCESLDRAIAHYRKLIKVSSLNREWKIFKVSIIEEEVIIPDEVLGEDYSI